MLRRITPGITDRHRNLRGERFDPGIPVTVSKESSQTGLRLVTLSATGPPTYNITTVPYGSPYVLRMDVTNSSGQPCANPITELIAYPWPAPEA